MSLANKVVIVTGASSGIGAAAAIVFAREGANVTIVGRNEKKLKDTEDKISKIGKAPLVVKADVGVDKDAERIIQETLSKYGKLDVLVNNAGVFKPGSVLEGNILDAYDSVMSVNVRAVINMTRLAAPHLIKTKGNIVNISSVAGMSAGGNSYMMCYSLSKAALDFFTKASAAELAPSGVRVNSINPGPVVTDFLDNNNMANTTSWEKMRQYTATKRVSSAEEIAEMIVFVAGDKGAGMTGSLTVIDNGALLAR